MLANYMKGVLLIVAFLTSVIVTSQTRDVTLSSLKGEYTGGCKKGKADGFGTAKGIDSYTGNFKNGYPDGEGKYIWKNGTWYSGSWKNGVFDGNGTFSKVDEKNPDSTTLITGFWQQGKYIGQYKKSSSVISLTNGINDVNSRKIRDEKSEITIAVKSTTSGGASLKNPLLPAPKLVGVEIIQGTFLQQVNNETSALTNVYTLRKVTFPFSAILTFETTGTNPLPMALEKIKIEISEMASWYIHVNIDN